MDITIIIQQLRDEVNTLKKEFLEMKYLLNEFYGSESYYQRHLELMLNATHKVTKYGITDITTDTSIIEIKKWNQYKSCLGQLISYNHHDNKQLIAAFYGPCKDKQKIIELFHQKNIEIWDLCKTENGIDITKCKIDTEVELWLNEHLEYSRNSILHSKNLYSMIFPSQIVSNIKKNRIRKEVDGWIMKNFPDVKTYCKESQFNNIKYCGWLHFRVKQS